MLGKDFSHLKKKKKLQRKNVKLTSFLVFVWIPDYKLFPVALESHCP